MQRSPILLDYRVVHFKTDSQYRSVYLIFTFNVNSGGAAGVDFTVFSADASWIWGFNKKKIGNVTENITGHFSEFEGVCGSDMQVSPSVSSRRDGIDQIENGQNSNSDLTDGNRGNVFDQKPSHDLTICELWGNILHLSNIHLNVDFHLYNLYSRHIFYYQRAITFCHIWKFHSWWKVCTRDVGWLMFLTVLWN